MKWRVRGRKKKHKTKIRRRKVMEEKTRDETKQQRQKKTNKQTKAKRNLDNCWSVAEEAPCVAVADCAIWAADTIPRLPKKMKKKRKRDEIFVFLPTDSMSQPNIVASVFISIGTGNLKKKCVSVPIRKIRPTDPNSIRVKQNTMSQ